MLRRFGFLVVATLLAAPVAAQDERPVQLTIGGGWTGVYGAGKDHVGSGGNFTIGALFKLNPVVGIQGEYGWNGMKQKQLQLPVSVNPLDSGVPTDFFADANMQYGAANVLFSPAVSGKTVGAHNLWMGQTHVPAATSSGNHHHGESETAIFVLSGTPVFVFVDLEGDEPVETRIQTEPGDYIFVPPYVPHREENPDPATEAVVVIARTTQEAIVVNLDGLDWSEVTLG